MKKGKQKKMTTQDEDNTPIYDMLLSIPSPEPNEKQAN